MPKNIVLCGSGAANEFAEDLTNFVKPLSTLPLGPVRQIVFYRLRLGRVQPPGALKPQMRIAAQANRIGFDRGLVFVVASFEVGDKLVFFSLSRGAYRSGGDHGAPRVLPHARMSLSCRKRSKLPTKE
jgi:uncharacterized protein (DUF2235 family)